MESVWPVSKLSTESVGSRRELVANCVHTADANATQQFRRVGVGGVYWALVDFRMQNKRPHCTLRFDRSVQTARFFLFFSRRLDKY